MMITNLWYGGTAFLDLDLAHKDSMTSSFGPKNWSFKKFVFKYVNMKWNEFFNGKQMWCETFLRNSMCKNNLFETFYKFIEISKLFTYEYYLSKFEITNLYVTTFLYISYNKSLWEMIEDLHKDLKIDHFSLTLAFWQLMITVFCKITLTFWGVSKGF